MNEILQKTAINNILNEMMEELINSRIKSCLRINYYCRIYKLLSDNNLEFAGEGYNHNPLTPELPCPTCYRDDNNIPHGKEYESCKSLHAEQHAIFNMLCSKKADPQKDTLIIFLVSDNKENYSCQPCKICIKEIVNSNINYIFSKSYKTYDTDKEMYYFNTAEKYFSEYFNTI